MDHPGNNTIHDILMSDTDRTRSPSPAFDDYNNSLNAGHGGIIDGLPTHIQPAFQAVNRSTPVHIPILKTKAYRPPGTSPAPPRSSSHGPGNTMNGLGSRRSRPETSHQKAVTVNRKMRIDRILFRKIKKEHQVVREKRRMDGRTNIFRAMKRIRDLPDTYDSEDDLENAWGPGGLLPNFRREQEDFGEEAIRTKKVLDRAVRRLEREENGTFTNGSKREFLRRKRKREDLGGGGERYAATMRKRSRINVDNPWSKGRGPLRVGHVPEEGLDDLDLDLLGEGRDDEQVDGEMDGESAGEESDDMTEDETMEVR